MTHYDHMSPIESSLLSSQETNACMEIVRRGFPQGSQLGLIHFVYGTILFCRASSCIAIVSQKLACLFLFVLYEEIELLVHAKTKPILLLLFLFTIKPDGTKYVDDFGFQVSVLFQGRLIITAFNISHTCQRTHQKHLQSRFIVKTSMHGHIVSFLG